MATKLAGRDGDRAVTRETADRDPMRHQVLMVTLEPNGRFLTIWAKGKREKFRLTYAEVYRLAYQIAARAAVEGGGS